MLRRELRFLFALWKTNLLSAMEYRTAFLTQVVGMMLNNGIYFIFWVIFFEKFKQIRGWQITDMFLLFGIVAAGFGLVNFLFGNGSLLVEVISGGRLDYYLSLPRPVLLHVVASRSNTSGLGDFIYGILSFIAAGRYDPGSLLRFIGSVLLAGLILLSFLVLVQSLTFWIGNSELLTDNAINAIITFSLYPINLFEGGARFLLFTIIPAAFIGAIPAQFVLSFSWAQLGEMILAGLIFLTLAVFVFQRGLRRYESGSAIQTQI